MRLAAALLAFGLCFYLGCCAERRLSGRARALRELCMMLRGFAVRIRYTAPTFAELVEGCDGGFASLVRERLRQGDIRAAWAEACDVSPDITEEARALLRELGRTLGTSAAEGQLSYLEMYLARAEELSSAADSQQKRLGRLYRTVGALAGAAAAIMII